MSLIIVRIPIGARFLAMVIMLITLSFNTLKLNMKSNLKYDIYRLCVYTSLGDGAVHPKSRNISEILIGRVDTFCF